jgi:tRNA (guanine26-N2/guanine27-N2)-dimethyltransferase
MHFCRDLTSLWVGTLPKLDIVVDGFCASAIRAIRYKLENENVGELKLYDRSAVACEIAKKNLELNRVKGEVFECNSNKFFADNANFDFVELDPFGSPVPFLDMPLFCDYRQKQKWISISATDTAVLCGAHKDACIKNYASKPLDNEFCHENGMRILLGHIAKSAARNDWELIPQICISHRHYFKIMAKLQKSAKGAKQAVQTSGYYSLFCQNCFYRQITDKFPPVQCPKCSKKLSWAGPLWGGKLQDEKTVEKMIELLSTRKYIGDKKIGKYLEWLKAEASAPALYYDVHEICSKFQLELLSMDEIIDRLRARGFVACRTTYKSTAIRTTASIEDIVGVMEKRM